MNKNKGTALAFSWFHYLTYPISRVWHFCSPFPTQTTAWTQQSPWTVIHEPNKLAFQWRAQTCWRCGARLSAHRIPAFRLAHAPGGPAFPSNLARNTKPSSRISPASFSLCQTDAESLFSPNLEYSRTDMVHQPSPTGAAKTGHCRTAGTWRGHTVLSCGSKHHILGGRSFT